MLKNKNRLLALVALAMALSQGFESCRASGTRMPAYDLDDEFHYAGALPLAASLVQQPGRSVAAAQKSRVSAMPDPDSDGEVYYDALPLAASLVQQPGRSVAASRKSAGSSGSDFGGDRDDDVSPVAVSRLALPTKFQAFQSKIAGLKKDINALLEESVDSSMSRESRYALLKKEKELYENLLFNNFPISGQDIDSHRKSLHLTMQQLRMMDAENALSKDGASMSKQFKTIHENERDLALIEILKAQGTSAAGEEALRLRVAVKERQRNLERELAEEAIAKRAAQMARIAEEEELSGNAQEAAVRLREREIADAEMEARIKARHRRAYEQKGYIAVGDSLIATKNHEIFQLKSKMSALRDEIKVLELRIEDAQKGIGVGIGFDLAKASDMLLKKQKSYKDALATLEDHKKSLNKLQARKLDLEYYVATGL